MQVQNNYTFALSANSRQSDFLEQLFFATRNTYNDLLRRFISDYKTAVDELPLERCSVSTLTTELDVMQAKPEYSHTRLAPRPVLIEKIKELSEALTKFLNEDRTGTAIPVIYEDRHVIHHCVFPPNSFFIRGNLLYVPGIELPFEIESSATSNMYPVKITLFRKEAGDYYVELLCAVSAIESVENLSF